MISQVLAPSRLTATSASMIWGNAKMTSIARIKDVVQGVARVGGDQANADADDSVPIAVAMIDMNKIPAASVQETAEHVLAEVVGAEGTALAPRWSVRDRDELVGSVRSDERPHHLRPSTKISTRNAPIRVRHSRNARVTRDEEAPRRSRCCDAFGEVRRFLRSGSQPCPQAGSDENRGDVGEQVEQHVDAGDEHGEGLHDGKVVVDNGTLECAFRSPDS